MKLAALALAVACGGSAPPPTVVVYFAQWSVPDMQLVAQLDEACGRRRLRCLGIDLTEPRSTLAVRNLVVIDNPLVAAAFGAEVPPAVRVYTADGQLVGRGTTFADADRLLAR